MKNYIIYILCCVSLFSCKKDNTSANLLVEGISLELAKSRKKQLANVVYNLDFKIPKDIKKPIISNLKLNASVNNVSTDLYLDFNEKTNHLKAITVNNNKVEIVHQKEHIIISKNDLKKGENTIEISFDAGELSLNRNDEFLYTLLVPDRASTLFPCFDQPDIKAHYQLNITAPKDWQVLCGAFEEKHIDKGDFIEHQFAQSDKMSTYLFSFVAGKFKEVKQNPGAFEMRFLYRENNPEKIAESVDDVFAIHQKAIDFLEEYTAYKFPFQKMDFAAIPPFQYGGMEHVGAIQYRESSLFLDKNATQTRKLARAKLIAHETAHMWFGDLVTMRWFNDVWMKEVFANFMADKIMNPVFPKINHALNFMMTHYPSAYSEDRTKGTNAIRQNLGNLKNAGSLYGRIIYNKAPIMMRQLEHLVGKKPFKAGIQEYIKKYENSNADWSELVTILDQKSKEDVKKWSKIWVNSSGRPIITDSITYTDGKISSFTLQQKAEDGSDKLWAQFFQIGLVYENEIKLIDANISGTKLVLDKAIGLPKPKQIIYNYNGLGYGVFPLDAKNINQYKNLEDNVARGYSYINAYEAMLNQSLSPFQTYQLFLSGIQAEKNERITNYLSGRIGTIFWKFLTQAQQAKTQPVLEQTIVDLLATNLPANIKRTLFDLYQSVAFSSEGKENVYAIWAKNKKIDNLFLNEDDYTNLAVNLVIFQHEKASEILAEQQKRIANPDRLKRFKWLLPSLSDNANIRSEFMRSLLQKEHREKESWVQSALSNIHHPLRQKEGIKHLKSCIEILEEIQLTGDIFFPKRWLLSSLGKYTSKEAHQIVTNFLNEHPNYNPVLKKKLLQVSDDLVRAQYLKK